MRGRTGAVLTDAYDDGNGKHFLGTYYVDSRDPDMVIQLDQATTYGIKQDAPFLAAQAGRVLRFCANNDSTIIGLGTDTPSVEVAMKKIVFKEFPLLALLDIKCVRIVHRICV